MVGVPMIAGYGEPGFLASYLGVQAHGILWPAAGAPAPAIWPITPPMVSAKVRMLLYWTRHCSQPAPVISPYSTGAVMWCWWDCSSKRTLPGAAWLHMRPPARAGERGDARRGRGARRHGQHGLLRGQLHAAAPQLQDPHEAPGSPHLHLQRCTPAALPDVASLHSVRFPASRLSAATAVGLFCIGIMHASVERRISYMMSDDGKKDAWAARDTSSYGLEECTASQCACRGG